MGRKGPYIGHAGLRQYFADVASVWADLRIHAEDFRVVPGSVIVMGHVDAHNENGAFRRAAIWTWRLQGGRAVHLRVADLGPR
jgi:hypothetical protein